ncbi:carbohydrate ABC transporter permease [Embleya sp. NBC_00896]|uniref:carbohydrate ABC transporter permease n=1 Tax=Embleya sp. NBC_00896 TaxID=2975961 RepID=UPI0038648BC3|nr:sugar ABC transporter permease [Embleya sp. NBC_00896]
MFLAPFGVLFVAMYAVPVGYAIVESLHKMQRSGLGLTPPKRVYAGVENYTKALQDDALWHGVGRVLLFGVVQVPVMLGLALLLALLLDAKSARLKGFFRTAYFLPYAIPGVVATILWAFLYMPRSSPLVSMLDAVGLPSDFLGEDAVLWSIANVVTWTWTGYNMLVIYSALQAIPQELYEAAELDGCGPWRIAWRIKVPLVAPAIALTTVFSVIGTLQLFTEPRVLRPLTSSVDADYTPIMTAYHKAVENNDYGQGAAVSVLLALGTCVLSFAVLKLSTRLTNGRSSL